MLMNRSVSYVIALVIMIVGQIATKAMTGWDMIALDVINAMVISLSANGGYDAIANTVQKVRLDG